MLRIDKEGPWGRIEYVHHLSCGHQERRKRASKTNVLACTWCVVAEKQGAELRSLATPQKRDDDSADDFTDHIHSEIAISEREIAKLKAVLASYFKVPLESVDVAVSDDEGKLSISYGIIFLSSADIRALLAESDQQSQNS